jgi:hypothetical protein
MFTDPKDYWDFWHIHCKVSLKGVLKRTMASTTPDITAKPDKMGYPFANKGINTIPTNDERDSAAFKAYLSQQAENNTVTASSASPISGKSSFKSFIKGVFDIVNPLQHIPIVSSIYRHVTGDQISPGAHFVGDALYGGPIGGALAAADIAFEKKTGKGVGETVIASLTGSGSHTTPQTTTPAPDTMIAQNLSKVAPAAGDKTALASNKIIWSDNIAGNNTSDIIWASTSAMFPPSLPTGTSGEGPASPSTAQPALPAKGAVSTTVLQTQEAPAGAGRKPVPPELIASKMMEGLQKYAALKQAPPVPGLSMLH